MRLPLARRASLEELQERNALLEQRVEMLEQRTRALRQRNQVLRGRTERLRGRLRRRAGEDLEYVFILTYGRTGSTVLMGVLNSLPGYLIRGENYEAAYHLFRFHQAMTAAKTRWRRRSTRMTHPFFGCGDFPEATSISGCRRLLVQTVFRPSEETRVTGFKEIRWNQADVGEYVEWLRRVLPGARFVVNTRNLDDVSRSGMWTQGDFSEEIAERHRTALALADSLGDSAYHVHYDDYAADPTTLRGLVEWLGEVWDEQRVRDVFAVEHSVQNRARPPGAPEPGAP